MPLGMGAAKLGSTILCQAWAPRLLGKRKSSAHLGPQMQSPP